MELSYTHGPSLLGLVGDTVGTAFSRAVSTGGDREAVISCSEERRYTYRQLDAATERLAAALLGRGLQRGDRVGIWSPNRAEWVVTQLAAARVGAVLVPVNSAYRTHEMAYVLAETGARALLAARGSRSLDYEKMIDEARGGLPDLETVAFFDTPSYEELAVEGDRRDSAAVGQRAAELDVDDPAAVLYTSGAGPNPKGATLTHHNIVNNGRLLGALSGYGEADRVCVPVPLFHCFGLVASNLAALCHGAAVVLPGPSFDAAEVLAAVERERCTSLVGVPAMFLALLEHPERAGRDLSSLRTGVMAGAPCPPELVRRVRAELHVPELVVAYGMTETSPATAQTTFDDGEEARSATVGRAHPYVELKVIDAGGATVRRGQEGELCARGYALMRGYWADPARTAEVIDEHGWLHTGDLATMDEGGYVRITGRLKDIIIRGGENISSREVEQLLAGHPDVDEACVIGVPDASMGEQAMAWVRLRPGAALTGEELRLHCLRQVASFKVPRHIRIVDQLPVRDDGSFAKRRLQELAFGELGLGEVREFVGAYR